MSGIWLPLAAVTISIFLIIAFFTKDNVKTREVELYKWTLIVNVICCINATIAYIFAEKTNLTKISFKSTFNNWLLLSHL